ncbi:CesT family type III secretion system chaperone [Serratia odorifera]|uniref:CesT family type III secretion system chaperone n=1 Tax=Serratia odorifera TaxID=618 RepID=UPI0039FCFC3E
MRDTKLGTNAIYHTLVTEWLRYLGLGETKNIGLMPITINVDGRFDIHCCLTNNEKILLLAEWSTLSLSKEILLRALNENQPISQVMQPRIALRDGKYWQCWIDIPIYGCSLPDLIECFKLITQCVEHFLNDIDSEIHSEKMPSIRHSTFS